MAVLKRMLRWLAASSAPWRRWRLVATVDAGDELPERLPKRGVVLVGSPRMPQWAVFDCPCGDGHRLMLNLDTHRYPCWQITEIRPLSMRPSIDAISDAGRCHFVMRRGRILWASPVSSIETRVRPT